MLRVVTYSSKYYSYQSQQEELVNYAKEGRNECVVQRFIYYQALHHSTVLGYQIPNYSSTMDLSLLQYCATRAQSKVDFFPRIHFIQGSRCFALLTLKHAKSKPNSWITFSKRQVHCTTKESSQTVWHSWPFHSSRSHCLLLHWHAKTHIQFCIVGINQPKFQLNFLSCWKNTLTTMWLRNFPNCQEKDCPLSFLWTDNDDILVKNVEQFLERANQFFLLACHASQCRSATGLVPRFGWNAQLLVRGPFWPSKDVSQGFFRFSAFNGSAPASACSRQGPMHYQQGPRPQYATSVVSSKRVSINEST